MKAEGEIVSKGHPAVAITAIAAVAAIEIVALYHGINGKLFALSAFIIGAVAGVSFRELFDFIRGRKEVA